MVKQGKQGLQTATRECALTAELYLGHGGIQVSRHPRPKVTRTLKNKETH